MHYMMNSKIDSSLGFYIIQVIRPLHDTKRVADLDLGDSSGFQHPKTLLTVVCNPFYLEG